MKKLHPSSEAPLPEPQIAVLEIVYSYCLTKYSFPDVSHYYLVRMFHKHL